MIFDTIIRNGTIFTGFDQFKADIGIRQGKITALGLNLSSEKPCLSVDAENKYVLPGAIDTMSHCRFNLGGISTIDDFENISRAAACGGITTLLDSFPCHVNKPFLNALQLKRDTCDPNACVDYGLHAQIVQIDKITLEQINLSQEGVSSIILDLSLPMDAGFSDDGHLYSLFDLCQKENLLLCIKPDNLSLVDLFKGKLIDSGAMKKAGTSFVSITRPPTVESSSVERIRAIHRQHDLLGLYLIGLSLGDSLRLLRSRERLETLFASTCPHYLLLDETFLKRRDGYLYITNPPLREEEEIEQLWQGIIREELQVISSDSFNLTRSQKEPSKGDYTQVPPGIPGVETLLPIIFSAGPGAERIPINKLVRLLSTNPARIFGLYPQKGTITVSSDADLVLIDPDNEIKINPTKLQTHCDWNPYKGMLATFPIMTFLRGRMVVRDGEYIGDPGCGRYIKRNSWADIY